MKSAAKGSQRLQNLFFLLSIAALCISAGMWRYGYVHQDMGEMDEATSLSIFGMIGAVFFLGSSAGIGILWLAGMFMNRKEPT